MIGDGFILGFSDGGWGPALLQAAAMTIAVAVTGFTVGMIIGVCGAWAKLKGGYFARATADCYTTVLRGVPDLLVIYLFYFGSSALLTPLGAFFGASGFISLPSFLAGSLAIGMVCGAYHTEVMRGAYQAVSTGEIEAGIASGMTQGVLFRRIIAPLVLRHALPGLGNVWQLVLKESALVSVTGLIEIMRIAQIGAGSTRKPFTFFLAAALLYLLISAVSTFVFQRAESRYTRTLRAV